MRKSLQILAVAVVALSLLGWAATGAHRGWTRTSVPVKVVDDITGIESVNYERRFVMGVELVAAAWVAAALLGGLSFLFKPTNKHKNQELHAT